MYPPDAPGGPHSVKTMASTAPPKHDTALKIRKAMSPPENVLLEIGRLTIQTFRWSRRWSRDEEPLIGGTAGYAFALRLRLPAREEAPG